MHSEFMELVFCCHFVLKQHSTKPFVPICPPQPFKLVPVWPTVLQTFPVRAPVQMSFKCDLVHASTSFSSSWGSFISMHKCWFLDLQMGNVGLWSENMWFLLDVSRCIHWKYEQDWTCWPLQLLNIIIDDLFGDGQENGVDRERIISYDRMA